MSKKLTHLQKAGALVPMAILVGAWGIAVGNSGLASALGGSSATLPDVPATALEQPATVQRTAGGLDPQAGAPGAISTLSTNGIPSAALYAYHHAESLLGDADASCHLPWNLVAAIGRVESNHGRTQGNALSADGLDSPGIYGASIKKVADTDNGTLDHDATGDRPVGPFQFMPAVWKKSAVDADSDGATNPQDIDDSATTAGVFLCSGTGDLSTPQGARSAVQRFNDKPSYVDLVMKVSESYANGQYSQTPDGYSTSTVLTAQSNDQTLSSDERKKAKKKQKDTEAAEDAAKNTNNGSGGGTSGGGNNNNGGGGSGGGGNNNGGGGSGGGDNNNGGGGSSNPVGDTVKKTTDTVKDTVKKTTDTVKDTVKKSTDTVKKTTDTVKDTVKNLTGGH